MQNKRISLFDPDFANRILYHYECYDCLHIISNKSINQHKGYECENNRKRNKEVMDKRNKIFESLPCYCFSSKSIIEKCQAQKRNTLMERQKIKAKQQSKNTQSNNQVQCPICLQPAETPKQENPSKQAAVFLCKNGHQMHDDCLLGMIKFQIKKCPVCRENVEHKLYEWLSSQQRNKNSSS